MKKLTGLLSLLLLASGLNAQMISLNPADADGDNEVSIIFDAAVGNGEMVGADKVYCHLGAIVSGPDGTDWQNVVGNWGQDDGIGEMSKVSGESDKWELKLSPSARAYTSTPEGQTIFRLSMVFRSADGAIKGTQVPGEYSWGTVEGNQDNYVDLNVEAYINLTSPQFADVFLVSGEALEIRGELSATASELKISITEAGEETIENQTNVSSLNYDYTPKGENEIIIVVSGTISGIAVNASKTVNVSIRNSNNELALPSGLIKGINYHEDDTKVTLVLEAPGKDFVYVVGDFTNWSVSADYQMNVTLDGEIFWLEISGLTSAKEYVFQYWVNGTEARVGDPYAEKIADPWNDSSIPEEVYPSSQIPAYDKTDYQIASVLQTAQVPYEWAQSEETWKRPKQNELVIYELLVRDFVGSHSYTDLIDSLSYLKGLGINAIELMPIMEFEGNESWGYNPMYFFAPDKYYGTEDDLKKFIEAAHQQGIAVILDMVLNHAFGLNAMVKMYWDPSKNTVTDDSPWFNPVATHPFNVGFDFNHESQYTKDFMDTVNHYWINEYHFDGYRFDLSKGFTQVNSGDDVGGWSSYDASRVALLKRMKEEIRKYDDDAYIILEHFGDNQEETELAQNGMIMWRGKGFDFHHAMGGSSSNFGGADVNSHVAFMESHDEQRLLFETYLNGQSIPGYNTRDTLNALERAKMAAAFFFTLPGPKMLWQFGELGYDIDINFNGRVGNKPLPWGEGNLGYYENEFRQHLLTVYRELLNTRKEYSSIWNSAGSTYETKLSGNTKYISIDNGVVDFTIIGNFGLEAASIDPHFTHTGTWYDYFSGEEINVSNANSEISLTIGEFHVYTDSKISDGFDDVIAIYQNPVTISPDRFGMSDEITITFDANQADPDGTNGLVGASEVLLYSGVVKNSPTNPLSDVVDGIAGTMTKVSGETDKWEITLTPKDYYGVSAETNVFKIGMYFKDNSGNLGKGFRGTTIFASVNQSGNIVTVTPLGFNKDTEIILTFDAALGQGELANAGAVYMHGGVVTRDTDAPTGNDWANIVGNWGEDDGIGKMAKVPGSDTKWQLIMTPASYYNLAADQDIHWLSMVFRSADGNAKGTGAANSTFENGIVTDNGDIFVRVTGLDGGGEELATNDAFVMHIYPNPSYGEITIINPTGNEAVIRIFDVSGHFVSEKSFGQNTNLDLRSFESGVYFLKIQTGDLSETRRIIIK
jgi:1,4-alpha-glucan branching enzyme